MMDAINLVLLGCASVGSLVLGVLAAYAVLRAGFYLMRPQRSPAPQQSPVMVKVQPETAQGM